MRFVDCRACASRATPRYARGHERTRKPLPRPDLALARAAKAALSGMNRGRNVVFSAGHEVRRIRCGIRAEARSAGTVTPCHWDDLEPAPGFR